MAKHYSTTTPPSSSLRLTTKRRAGVEAGLGLLACCILVLLLVMAGRGTASITGLAFYGVLFGVFVAFSINRLAWMREDDSWSFHEMLPIVIASLASAPVLECLTLFGSPYHSVLRPEDWSITQTCLWACVAYTIIASTVMLAHSGLFTAPSFSRKKALITSCTVIATVALGLIAAALVSALFHISAIPLFIFFVALIIVIATLVWGHIAAWPTEWLFLPICLAVGVSFALLAPAKTYVGWDDEYHFPRTVALSYLMNPAYSDSEKRLATDTGGLYVGIRDPLNPESDYIDKIEDIEETLDLGYRVDSYEIPGSITQTKTAAASIVTPATIAYAPAAIGLWVGRLLHLPFTLIVTCGRVVSVVAYAFVVFLAIRLSSSKKALMACIALLPTSIFLAASYSYDSLIIAFSMLGYALVLRAATSQRRCSWWFLIITVVCFLVACAPKMVYFPLLGLILIIPASNYPSKNARNRIILGTVVLAVCIAAAIVVPKITQGFGIGDTRGGESVNAANQVDYILNNPGTFAHTMTAFLSNIYLSPTNSGGYALSFAYLSDLTVVFPFLTATPALILVAVALLDSNRKSWPLAKSSVRIWSLILFSGMVLMIAAALYIDFTPVGADTVNGCQPRYLLPILFMALALCLNFKIDNLSIDTSLQTFSTGVMGCLGMTACWFLFVFASAL